MATGGQRGIGHDLVNVGTLAPGMTRPMQAGEKKDMDEPQTKVKNIDGQDKDDGDAPITQEHINHARLCNALTTVCSRALREILLTNVPMPHTDIYKTILANEAKLKKQLNKDQVQLVFPDLQGLITGKIEEFDISLLYAIIRNVSSVPSPSNGWGNPPADNPRDTTLGDRVERIRLYRNVISGHYVDGKISQQEFEDYWAKIDEVLREIEIVIGNHGYLEDLEKLKNQVIIPHEARELQKKLQEYKRKMDAIASDTLLELENVKSTPETVRQSLEKAKSHITKLQDSEDSKVKSRNQAGANKESDNPQTEIKTIYDKDKDDVDSPITQEHINHARLCNALTTVCSNALREILLTNVPMPHTDIYMAILANEAKLKKLLKKEQFQLVYQDPQGKHTGMVQVFNFSLLYIIIRNVSSVPAPTNGWGKPPNDNPRDTTLGASVERIRIYRNYIIGHSVDGKISQQEFEDYWVKIDEVLHEIEIIIGNHGYQRDLEKRKNQAITPQEAFLLQNKCLQYKSQTEGAEASKVKSVMQAGAKKELDELQKKVNNIDGQGQNDVDAPITKENINYFILSIAVFTVCTNALRDILLINVPMPHTDIYKAIMASKARLTKINLTQIRLISDSMGHSTGRVEAFDISLLYTLIRNVSSVPAASNGWGKPPTEYPRDTTLGASVERIHSYRNHLDYLNGEISQQELEDCLSKISKVLSEIEIVIGNHGYQEDLEKLKKQAITLYEVHERQKTFKDFKRQTADPLLPEEILSMDDNSIQLYKKALDAGMEKVYNIRVMVVGQFGVGKTTLIKRLLGQPVDISERKSTEGIDVHTHCCKISLDKGEWLQQVEDYDQLHTLNRLIKLLAVPDQKPDISQEREGIRNVFNQMEITSEIYDTESIEPSTISVTDEEVKSSTQFSIVREDEIHHVEHVDKETAIVAVPLSDAKSSDSEKKTNDAMMEIIRLVNANVDKLVKDTEKYAALSIWDFAGQHVFYSTHQMFLTSQAIYLLVIDLNQQITNFVTDDTCSIDADGFQVRQVLDLVQIWMNSIHSIVRSPNDIIPVILVGTHADQIPEKSRKEVIDKYFLELRYMLGEQPTINHLINDIAIDNTQPDPMLEELKKIIFELSKQQPNWGEGKPARWLPLEQAIMTLKASGTKIVQLKIIEHINMSGSVKIDDRNELELFLQYHHDIGTIIYFSVEDLREKIILDPQWMIDAIKSLITAEKFIRKYPAITTKFSEFINTGKLTHELIDAIWSKENNPEFHDNKDHILRLMEQLNIIAIPCVFSEEGKEIKAVNYFFAPCMLHVKPPREVIFPEPHEQMESSSVLCYVFTGKFLPTAIFHRLLAACIAQWPLATKTIGRTLKNQIFCGCGVFRIDSLHKLTLYFSRYSIFMRITKQGLIDTTPSSKLCIEVREFIAKVLNKLIGYLGHSLKFEECIQCPYYSGEIVDCHKPVNQLKEKKEVCCDSHDKILDSENILKFWFDDEVKNKDCQDADKFDVSFTQEHFNFFNLYHALITVCANALREILLTNVPKPYADIYKAIQANKDKLIDSLFKEQKQLLFPDHGGHSTAKVEDFDITLLCKIISKVSTVSTPSKGWGQPPDNTDTSLGASVVRIRIYRNKIIGHSVNGKINQQEFKNYWAMIEQVLREIEIVIGNHGYLEYLEKLKNQPVTPREARELQKKIQKSKS